MTNYLNEYKQMIVFRNLSDHTFKSYCTYITVYLDYCQNILYKSPEDMSWQDIRDFIMFLQCKRNLANRTINACIAQLKFFTNYVLHKKWDDFQVPKKKFNTFLPFVPSQQQVNDFIDSFDNLKHKAMVALMYSSGLRLSEVCALKYDDITRANMRIRIRYAKNRQEDFVPLSKKTLDILTKYWKEFGKPTNWLFPKQRDKNNVFDKPIDTFYISRHIKAKCESLKLPYKITCHSLRHAYGTHLYEMGNDILTIKKLLRHKSLASTLIYVHIANNSFNNVINPFDEFEHGRS